MSEENKLWSVVEFDDDSIHIVPKNWFLDKSKCYWPTQGTFKTINSYIKSVKKMASPDDNWPVFEAQILASSDDFDVAFKKLKKAETHTDLATDAEQDKLSRNLRHRKRTISSLSSSDEDITSNITLAKLPAVPKPPSSGTSDINQKNLASGTEQFSKKSRSSAKKPVSYDYEEHFESPVHDEPSNGHQTNSKNVRRTLSYNSETSTDYQTNLKRTQPNTNYDDEPYSGHPASHSKRSQPTTNYDDEPYSGHSASHSKRSQPTTNYDDEPYSGHSATNSKFQERVLRTLSHIKLHLFKLDEKLSALNYPAQQNMNVVDTYDNNILQNFPLQCETDLQNVEIKLKNDEIYKSNMLTALSKMGGTKTDEATKYILKKIYTDKLAMCYSWMGGKGKKVLSTMILPKIIIEVVQKRIQNCTEIDVVSSIKNWLRHAYQRNLNSSKAAEKRSLEQINKEVA